VRADVASQHPTASESPYASRIMDLTPVASQQACGAGEMAAARHFA
jgi:hypothetical protein